MKARHPVSMLRGRVLACVRGEKDLFSGLTFELRNGGLLQVCGANGSGKTSLLRMVCGFLPPASGEITWNDRPVGVFEPEYRAGIAYVGHLNAVKDELDPVDNLRSAARLAGLPSGVDEVIDSLRRFGVGDFLRLPCRSLSLGQKRRVALARLNLSGGRALWILDEPFAALDEGGIAVARTLLESHLACGGLALLATHRRMAVKAPESNAIELGT